MEILNFVKAKHKRDIEKPLVSKQTGFPSPATHYLEPTLNLHNELVENPDATYFVRIDGNGYKNFNVLDGDVLILDRSLKPKHNDLILAVIDDAFSILKMQDDQYYKELQLWGVITFVIHKIR